MGRLLAFLADAQRQNLELLDCRSTSLLYLQLDWK
jgi:hypothetical protein